MSFTRRNPGERPYPRRRRDRSENRVGTKPTLVGNVLQSVLKDKGLDQQIARYQFVTKWEQIVGREIALRTKPECIRNNCLVIRVSDSAWAQELSFQKPVLLKRLRRYMDSETALRDIQFYVVGDKVAY